MNAADFFRADFRQHLRVVEDAMLGLEMAYQQLAQTLLEVFRRSGKVIFFGNGGSAADAQHLATEFMVRFNLNRKPFAAIALTTDTSCLTAIGNDLGFDRLFERQIEALCSSKDLAIGISTSGNSENVIRGLVAAKELGAITAAFGGGDGGRIKDLVDHALIVPSKETPRIQEVHILLGHSLCGFVEAQLAN
ncbi:Phosphoheptose isomerase [Syntrophobacter sp. SbD1]|nr:Phosphoheptose isomerase [Syntrophobacter sp. SbD1]